MTRREVPVRPGSTIGILGGGQLGRMLALAAARLGLHCHISAPEADSTAFEVAARHTIGAYEDEAALAAFADAVDVITYEFENVPAATAAFLAARRPVRPGPAILGATQDRLVAFAKGAAAEGFHIIIAGAGGAAHLPGMTAAMTQLPVFGVPVESKALSGRDSLLSIVQMPAGIPVGTLAIGRAGAVNAALLAAAVLALSDPALAGRLAAWRQRQTDAVAERPHDEA